MSKRISIALASAFAAVLTHGAVSSGMHFESSKLMPPYTYQGFFARALTSIWRLWGYAHGWMPMSHVEEFGRFYASLVLLTCPLIGFGVFWFVSRQEAGRQFWKPLAVAIAFATPVQQFMRQGFLALGMDEPAAEATRAVVVLLLMIFSIGLRQKATEQAVIA